MKRLLLSIAIMLFVVQPVICQSSEWNGISAAISEGSASKLSVWFAPNVTVSLPKHRGTFSANQVRSMVSDFFKENPPASFKMNHSGQTTQGGTFYLCNYSTRGGKIFTVYILLTESEGKQRISRISFEHNP